MTRVSRHGHRDYFNFAIGIGGVQLSFDQRRISLDGNNQLGLLGTSSSLAIAQRAFAALPPHSAESLWLTGHLSLFLS
jgi:hypothetical protein